MISTVRGRFGDFEGTLEAAPDYQSSVRGTVEAASIDTKKRRAAHLRSADLFDVEQHPVISIESTAIEHVEQANFRVAGDLTMHGETRPVHATHRFPFAFGRGDRVADPLGGGCPLVRVDQRALTSAAYERGVLVEPTTWHWAQPEQAPPSLVLGYGGASAPAIRRGLALLSATLLETSRAGRRTG